MKKTNSLIQSTTAKLSKLARSQGNPFDKVLTLFLLERAVVRMVSDETLSRHLIFKGGYVSVRVYDSPRFTIDIDAVLHGLSKEDAIKKIKETMSQSFPDAVRFKFESEVELVTQSEYGGHRLVYRSGLGEPPEPLNRAQIIDIDIGTGDPVTPSPLVINTPTLLGPESISWQVYPVETILAEKLHSLVTKGSANSRAKDIFDVWLLLPRADQKTLKKALKATFSYREEALPKNIGGLLKEMDQSLLKKGWKSAASYVRSAENFDVTVSQIIEVLENWGV